MTNDTELIYVVHRSFQTRLGAVATVPIASFRDKAGAQQGSTAEDRKISTFLGFRVVAPDGTVLNGNLGRLLSNMGIAGIGHAAHGPLQVSDAPSAIVHPSRVIVPPR